MKLRDVMDQIKGTVAKAGMSMDDMVSMQVFVNKGS